MRALILIAAGALGLSACADRDGRATAGACKAFPKVAVATTEPATVVDDCLHRWAYTLARSEEDAADVVAQAVVAACAAPLSRWNQQSLTQAAAEGGDRALEAPSLLTGEPTNPIAARGEFTGNRALFYVVQARAGNCAAPPRREAAAEASAVTADAASPDR